jgi:hypothetical protein
MTGTPAARALDGAGNVGDHARRFPRPFHHPHLHIDDDQHRPIPLTYRCHRAPLISTAILGLAAAAAFKILLANIDQPYPVIPSEAWNLPSSALGRPHPSLGVICASCILYYRRFVVDLQGRAVRRRINRASPGFELHWSVVLILVQYHMSLRARPITLLKLSGACRRSFRFL